VGRCGSALAADTQTVYLPFVSSIMLGNNSPTWMSTSTYQLSNTAMIDSITWLLNGGQWIHYPNSLSDSATVQWTGASGSIQAVRWGRLAADTVTAQVTVQGVGLDESGQNVLKIYPNPAKDVLYLNQVPRGRMVLSTMMGQVVKVLDPSARILVTDLPNGSYVLTWESPTGPERRVFVVQH